VYADAIGTLIIYKMYMCRYADAIDAVVVNMLPDSLTFSHLGSGQKIVKKHFSLEIYETVSVE
jgi:hypothetical protein